MDLTTEFGRQQAHAAGGQAHRIACLIEEALAAEDRQHQHDALTVLFHVREVDAECCDEFDQLLDRLAKELSDGEEDSLYKGFFEWRSKALAAQMQRDQLTDLAIDVLSGNPIDHGQELAKILHGERNEMAR